MDLHPTPFPGKLRASNLKTNKKSIPENKKEPPLPRQKRVFGTSRNTNVQEKVTSEKPISKPRTGVARKQPRDTSVKPRVTKGQPTSPKVVETEEIINGVVSTVGTKLVETEEVTDEAVSSPAVDLNSVETEEVTNGVVCSPAVKVKVVETEESTNGVVSSPATKIEVVESEEVTNGVVSSPSVKVKSVETEKSSNGVVSSPLVKAKYVETEESSNGVVSSPSVKAKSVETEESSNGVVSSLATKTKLVETGEVTNGVVSSPSVKAKLVETGESTRRVSSSPSVKAVKKNSSGKSVTRSKKNVCFQEPSVGKIGQEEVHTPTASSSSLIKPPRVSGTPYHSAENCSKCRLHRLESSSYWIAQIKLAESVEKHFVAATFFGLALECNAEPVRSLRIELRSYLARHGSLSKETEWKNISLSYGLLKGESNVARLNSALEKAASTSETSIDDLSDEQENSNNGFEEKEIAKGNQK